jgi:hypothetical protein
VTPFWVTAVTFVAFACAAFLTTRFAEWATSSWPRLRDLPVIGEPPPLVVATLIAGTGCIGATYLSRGASFYALGLIALLCLTLDFACCCDLRIGRLPLAVTVPALGLLLLSAVLASDWLALIACAIVATPFAIGAAFSKSKGFGWSEVQLVMLGALVLNVTLGLLTFAIACFLAVGVALVRGTLKKPVVFSPYLALTIELALLTPSAIR